MRGLLLGLLLLVRILILYNNIVSLVPVVEVTVYIRCDVIVVYYVQLMIIAAAKLLEVDYILISVILDIGILLLTGIRKRIKGFSLLYRTYFCRVSFCKVSGGQTQVVFFES